jgi:hypothetical protein
VFSSAYQPCQVPGAALIYPRLPQSLKDCDVTQVRNWPARQRRPSSAHPPFSGAFCPRLVCALGRPAQQGDGKDTQMRAVGAVTNGLLAARASRIRAFGVVLGCLFHSLLQMIQGCLSHFLHHGRPGSCFLLSLFYGFNEGIAIV